MMADEQKCHPKSVEVERVSPEVIAVFTPCHGARVFFTADAVRPGTVVEAMCPRCGHSWQIEIVPGEHVGRCEARWADRSDVGGR
ncbi:MAG: hypothetical protein ACRD0K_19530 [Egibacteraceae bacterium]